MDPIGRMCSVQSVKADTLAKTLLFCTVRVTNTPMNGGDDSVGTAFFFNASQTSDGSIMMLVSNKHVIENAKVLTLEILVANGDYSGPELGAVRRFQIRGNPVPCIGHPDPAIDIAVLPIASVLQEMSRSNETPFIKALSWAQLPTTAAMSQFDSMEQLTFVGYPGGLKDPVNHTPIARQGITATPIGIPFNGLPSFLLDGAVFGGSSGSPVFIFNQTSWADSSGNINLGSRLFLVGIIAQNWSSVNQSPVRSLPAAAQPFVEVSQALHLGVAFSAIAIVETINHALEVSGLQTGAGARGYQ